MKPIVKDNDITEVLKYVCSLTGLNYQEETNDYYERAYYDYTPASRIALVNDCTPHLKIHFRLEGDDVISKYDCSDWKISELIEQIGVYQKQIKNFLEDMEMEKIKDDFK